MQRGDAYEVGEGGGLRLVVASTLEGEAEGAGSGIPLDGGAAAEPR
jgi:hypothetical protein